MASSELLKQIQGGKALKKVQTNDRSAPQVDGGPKLSSGSSGGGGPMRIAASSSGSSAGGGPPQLGGLFAGGMPTLKPSGGPGEII